MPLPVLVWLPNAFFVILTVVIVFLTLNWIVDPPRSFAEGVVEAHKVVIVGGVSLAAVAIVELIEIISVAPNLTQSKLAVVVVGTTVLVGDAFFGMGLFAAALVRDAKIRATNRIDRPAFWQVLCGLLVFAVATLVIVKFKYLGLDIETAMKNVHPGAGH